MRIEGKLTIGQVVALKKQFQDAGDEALTFVVSSLDNYPRIALRVREQDDWTLQPMYTVTPGMVEGPL